MSEQGQFFTDNAMPKAYDLTISQFQTLAAHTDKLKATAQPLDLPFLGLLGEIGSVVAEVKKRERGDRPSDVYVAAVKEELGDSLWYCATICRRLDLNLSEIAAKAVSQDQSNLENLKFADVQRPFSDKVEADMEAVLAASIELAAKIGIALSAYSDDRITFCEREAKDYLVALMASLLEIASTACVEIQDAAAENVAKILDRWPIDRNFPPLLDTDDVIMERLPRKLKIDIFEREVGDKTFVYQRCNEINIGDPLTDNREDQDDYRFHDVFHYSYAAVLGWSPVLRALFKIKRKSNKLKDENQDGARAILIEEGIATWVFGQARRQDLFASIERGKLSYDLLKSVRQFAEGYEAEQCPLWVWEEAILSGFTCFRFLVENRSGRLTLDLKSHSIDIEHLPT